MMSDQKYHSKKFLVWLASGLAKHHGIKPNKSPSGVVSLSVPFKSTSNPEIVYEVLLVKKGKHVDASINLCHQTETNMTRVAVIALNDDFEFGNWSEELLEIFQSQANGLKFAENAAYKKMLLQEAVIPEPFIEDGGLTLGKLENTLAPVTAQTI